ncbi:uncharacterized protein LOC100888988 [Strongylocentrotus purpuratus]|uniref:Uncharacterized protein n=1 Tax=Strongylocentrotus purpuratus TaxID=7668 RepID=A0A7M7LP28_STRPU|nr:uncharacterized protein LOC100888988 [Strongylocentrotus purpuratus]|eukprot:XP_003724207.2 PREDICTED: uncharacterized protein LOC100888988 [Strongylocentrotus purpuratus]
MDGKGNNRGAFVTAIAIIIIIIITAVITAVICTQNNKSDQVVQCTPTLASSVDQEMTTTQPPTMTTTTFGPAVIGNFEGTFVMDKAYGTYLNDGRAPATTAFFRNFTGAMDEVYNVTSAAKYLYQQTFVTQLVQNGTYVQVRFTVELNAINRGGRDYLVNTLGSFPSNALNTYDVLYANIGPEKDPSTGA